MSNDTLVERVARAIRDVFLEPWAEYTLAEWHEKAARAAIAAMLEPTEAMVKAAGDVRFGASTGDVLTQGEQFRRRWPYAMVEALK